MANPVSELSVAEAAQLLLASRELLADEELLENLAGIDEQCGGVMEAWSPPWAAEGVEAMAFESVASHPAAVIWAASLANVIERLWANATEAQLLPPGGSDSFVVVLPEGAPFDVLAKLVRLGGGQARTSSGLPESLPFCRLIVLDAYTDRANGHCAPSLGSRATPFADAAESRTRTMLAVLSANSEAASGRRRELPSSIKFIHLDALQAATNAYGEAAGLIMGVVQLLRQAEIWSKFQALDSYCDNLLSNWEPPWVPEDLEEEERRAAREMNLNRLAQEDESTVYDWAMALDGFLSFVANLAVAARVHAAGEVETERFHIEELQKEPSGSFTPAQSSELPKAKSALVVVVPDMTDWHLEVFGPLLRALKIFMLAEQAWRADFDAASSVPFSVEAAVRAGG